MKYMNRKTIFLLVIVSFCLVPFCLSGEEKTDKQLSGITGTPELPGEWTCIAYVERIDDFALEQGDCRRAHFF